MHWGWEGSEIDLQPAKSKLHLCAAPVLSVGVQIFADLLSSSASHQPNVFAHSQVILPQPNEKKGGEGMGRRCGRAWGDEMGCVPYHDWTGRPGAGLRPAPWLNRPWAGPCVQRHASRFPTTTWLLAELPPESAFQTNSQVMPVQL